MSCAIRPGLFTGGRVDISYDEQRFSRAHEPQLTPRNLLDCGGVFTQPASFMAQPGVFGPEPRKIGCELIILFPRAHRSDESLIADQRVDDEHADNEEEETGKQTASAGLRLLKNGLRFERLTGHRR